MKATSYQFKPGQPDQRDEQLATLEATLQKLSHATTAQFHRGIRFVQQNSQCNVRPTKLAYNNTNLNVNAERGRFSSVCLARGGRMLKNFLKKLYQNGME